MALLLVPAAVVRADDALKDPVQVDMMGFTAVVNDGRVVSTWKRYKRNDFASYKLVKSAKADPMYPGDTLVSAFDDPGVLRFEDGKLSLGTWHYRLVIVTRFGDRWASPAVTVNIDEAALKRAAPTGADFE